MAIVEKEELHRRLSPTTKANRSHAQPQQAISDEPDVDIATVLANELRNIIRNNHDQTLSSQSEVLLDREFNGYRVIILRVPRTSDHATTLSPREHEIARMVAKGYPNKTIAAVLEISTWTVGTHLRRMFAKLGVSSRAAMVAQLIHLYDEE